MKVTTRDINEITRDFSTLPESVVLATWDDSSSDGQSLTDFLWNLTARTKTSVRNYFADCPTFGLPNVPLKQFNDRYYPHNLDAAIRLAGRKSGILKTLKVNHRI